MEPLLRPVDVIALWGADGKLQPLRLRLPSDSGPQRVDILKVVQEKPEHRYGWEGSHWPILSPRWSWGGSRGTTFPCFHTIICR